MIRYIYIAIILTLVSGSVQAQQEVMLTQFMYNKLSLNPAYAGEHDYTEALLTYRDQYNGFPGAPSTQLVSVNLPRVRENMGLGFGLRNQTHGITQQASLSAMYAYKILTPKYNFSLGMQVSGRRYSLDFTDERLIATQGIELDPSIPKTEVSRYLMNVGLGVYFAADNYYISLSSPGIIKSDIDFDNNDILSKEPRHVYLMGGASFRVAESLDFKPQLLFKYASNAPFDVDLNLGLTLDDKYTGAITYRFGGADGDVGESIDVMLGFQLTEQFLLGFSLDFTLSKLREYDNGSIELVAGYSFVQSGNKVKMINPRYF